MVERRMLPARALTEPLMSLLLCVSAILCLLAPAFAQSLIVNDMKRDTPGKPIKDGQSVRIDVELALVNVTVTDPYSRLVTGLEADNFRVFEDNVEQEVVSLSSEDVPTSVGVIFDHSGSMTDKLGKAREPPFNFSRLPIPRTSSFLSVSMIARTSLVRSPTAWRICRAAYSRPLRKAAPLC